MCCGALKSVRTRYPLIQYAYDKAGELTHIHDKLSETIIK